MNYYYLQIWQKMSDNFITGLVIRKLLGKKDREYQGEI